MIFDQKSYIDLIVVKLMIFPKNEYIIVILILDLCKIYVKIMKKLMIFDQKSYIDLILVKLMIFPKNEYIIVILNKMIKIDEN